MNKELVNELVNLFIEDNNGNDVDYWIDQDRLFIKSETNDFMLRDNYYFKEKELVIARILFNNQRKGYGSKVLGILEDFCIGYYYNKIKIESVMTKEMQQFALKNNFINTSDGMDILGYGLNWEKYIS